MYIYIKKTDLSFEIYLRRFLKGISIRREIIMDAKIENRRIPLATIAWGNPVKYIGLRDTEYAVLIKVS